MLFRQVKKMISTSSKATVQIVLGLAFKIVDLSEKKECVPVVFSKRSNRNILSSSDTHKNR